MKDQHNVVPFQPKVISLSFQLTTHTPTTLEGSVLKSVLDALVDDLLEKGIMADYRCVDVLGRDLVPVEEPKQY